MLLLLNRCTLSLRVYAVLTLLAAACSQLFSAESQTCVQLIMIPFMCGACPVHWCGEHMHATFR